MYNLYSILKISEHDVILVRRLHSVSPALLSLGYGFEPHLVHRFLTFYADLIKWSDGLMGQPDMDSRAACRVGFEPHLVHRFLTFYVDLIKWSDGLMGQPDMDNRAACRAWDAAAA
jgi:hypothetical protein